MAGLGHIMTQDWDSKDKISELRRRAESSFSQKAVDAVDISTLSQGDVQKLVHELRVHQIELEMQNLELRQAQIALEELKDRYLDLYDFAPVGYFTLDQNGVILEANLTSAHLFGVERGLLIGKPFASFVNQEDGDSLYLHFGKVLETRSKQTCELRLTKKYGDQISVRIDSLIGKSHDGSPTVLRTAVIDITPRKQAEEALNSSELRYRRLFESAQDGILILDFETGQILDVNPYLIDMLGYPHEDFLEKCLWEVSPFKDTDLNKESFEKLRRDGYVRYEDLPLETFDGRSIDVEFVSNSYPVNGKTFIQCNIRDITKRKHDEEQLRVETARSRLALDILKQLNQRLPTIESVKIILETLQKFNQLDAVAIRLRDGGDFPYLMYDGFTEDFIEAERYLCARDADGEIIRDEQGNPCLECMCGNVLKGRTDRSLPFFTERGSFWSNCTTDLLASTTEEDRQARTRNRCNGEGYESVALIPLRSEEEIVGLLQLNDRRPNRFTLDMVCFMEEIGESIGIALKRAQMRQEAKANLEMLTIEREQLLSIFESINEVILVIDPRTYEIVFANKFAEEVYGKRLIGGICYEKLNGFANPCEDCANKKILELQGQTYQWEYSNSVLKRDFVADDRMIKWPDGRKVKFHLAIEVTQQKTLQKQLLQSQKMEAVGTLAGGIAHDFNNLLQIISGHAELLEMELAQKSMRFSEMDAIRQSAHRGADLVKQILTFSRRIDSKFESICLNEEVRSTERLLYRTIPKMIDIALRLEEGIDRVRADATQIEQLLINLAVNAKDAMPEGGKLIIETEKVFLDEDYCRSHAELVPGRYVLLRVSDTGHGMEQGVLQHIFEPFFTTKGLADGTGLGLATVFGIVKMHGGHINCESELGQGTTFEIYFPAAEADKPEVVGEPEVTLVAGGTETILVVDDEPMIRELAKRILEKSGYSVLTAGSGKEGIEVYAQHKSDISLVILDLIMPEMGGKQCLEELLKINPQIKALIASGFAIKGDTKTFLDTEAKGIVPKPFNMRELLRSVRHVLDGM